MSSTNSSSSHGSWSGELGSRKSPIPYRIGPLNYEPAVFCHCRMKAALWISWSDDNPGRRYLKCFRARHGGCQFVRWFEGPWHPFVQSLLVDLRDAVWSLKQENKDLQVALSDAVMKLEQEKKEVAELKLKLQRMESEAQNAMVHDGRMKKLERERCLFFVVCVTILVVCLFLKL
ncbi:unnamed protein product [Urochloa humidicola]